MFGEKNQCLMRNLVCDLICERDPLTNVYLSDLLQFDKSHDQYSWTEHRIMYSWLVMEAVQGSILA